MSEWDKFVSALILLALVAVAVSARQSSNAISSVGNALKTLSQNIVGVPQQSG